MKNYVHVGKVKSAHGLKGEIFIFVFSKDTSWSKKLKNCQLKNLKSEISDHNVERSKPHKEGLIMQLANVSDRNQSESLIGQEFYIPDDLLQSEKGETIYLSEILGFDVYLGDQCVGQVQTVSSNGPQDLLVIRNEEHLFEVPFVKDFIVQMDFENSKVLMNFPPELIELNRK